MQRSGMRNKDRAGLGTGGNNELTRIFYYYPVGSTYSRCHVQGDWVTAGGW